MREKFLRRSAVAWPFVALITGAEITRAAELSLRMSLRLGEAYNDNVRLVSAPRTGSAITTLSPGMEASLKTETFTATGKARIGVNRYHGDSTLDNVDLIFDTFLAQQFERNRLEVAMGYARDSTLGSELRQTGLVQANRERARASATPAWTMQLNERASWKIGYDYADVSYKDRGGTGLTNYRGDTATTTLNYRWSERTNTFVTGGLSRLKPDSNADPLRTTFMVAGLQRDLTELMQAELSAGVRRVRPGDGNSDDNGWLASARLRRRLETGSITLAAAREINPTGSADLTQTDQLSASWQNSLSPRLTIGIDGSVYRNETLGSPGSVRSDRYYRVGANMTWLATQRWAIETELSHARQQPDQGRAVKANTISINARYDWPL